MKSATEVLIGELAQMLTEILNLRDFSSQVLREDCYQWQWRSRSLCTTECNALLGKKMV